MVGFRGWRERWWPREAERPFPDWMTAGLPERERADVERLNRCRERARVRLAQAEAELAAAMRALEAAQP